MHCRYGQQYYLPDGQPIFRTHRVGAILFESVVEHLVNPETLKGSLKRTLKYPESEADEKQIFPFFDKLDQL